MEQQIIAHEDLGHADEVGMQQCVTRVDGSMTRFGFLLRGPEERFAGQKPSR